MKRSFIALLLIVLLAVCLCVSCNDGPAGGSSASGDKWVANYTDTETEEGQTIEASMTMTLVFDGNGKVTATTYLKSMKLNGANYDISKMTKEQRTTVMTGTYTDSTITLTYTEQGQTKTTTGTYSILGNQLTLTADDETHVFTKQ